MEAHRVNEMRNIIGLSILLLLFSAKRGTPAINGMGKSRFLPPYTSDNKTTFREAQGKSGVYLIKNGGEITYIGHSKTNLYRTLYRHYQSWDDPTQLRVVYPKQSTTVRIIYTTPAQAERLERYLINRYQPRDNEQKIKDYAATQQDKADYEKYKEAEEFEPAPF